VIHQLWIQGILSGINRRDKWMGLLSGFQLGALAHSFGDQINEFYLLT